MKEGDHPVAKGDHLQDIHQQLVVVGGKVRRIVDHRDLELVGR